MELFVNGVDHHCKTSRTRSAAAALSRSLRAEGDPDARFTFDVRIDIRDGADDFVEAHKILQLVGVSLGKQKVELVKHGLAAKSAEGVTDILGDRNVACRHFTAKFVGYHFWSAGGANAHVITREPQSVCDVDACLGVKNAFGASFGKVKAAIDRANSRVVTSVGAFTVGAVWRVRLC